MSVRSMSGLTGLAAVTLLTGCSGGPAQSSEVAISGTVTYRQRIALAPDAVVIVGVDDVSRADAPAVRIAEVVIPADGRQVPIPFELPVDQSKVEATSRYNLVAEIHVGTTRLYRNTTAMEIDPATSVSGVEVVVDQVGSEPAGDGLYGGTWNLVEIGGLALGSGTGRTPSISFDSAEARYTGSGGCNGFGGGFTLTGDSLSLGNAMSTLMACPDSVMKLEGEFHAALRAVSSLRLEGGELLLVDPAGRTVRFRRG